MVFGFLGFKISEGNLKCFAGLVRGLINTVGYSNSSSKIMASKFFSFFFALFHSLSLYARASPALIFCNSTGRRWVVTSSMIYIERGFLFYFLRKYLQILTMNFPCLGCYRRNFKGKQQPLLMIFSVVSTCLCSLAHFSIHKFGPTILFNFHIFK